MTKISYTVNIDYKSFSFSNADSAILFAQTALMAMPAQENYSIEVKLTKEEINDASHIDNEI